MDRSTAVMRSILLLAVLIVGCSQGQPISNSTTTPSSSSCRLPISITQQGSGPKGAFVDFPSGTVTMDQSGAIARYYDRTFSRWLPVSSNSVSPDGSHYAMGGSTVEEKAILHIVDVASGSDHVNSLPDELFNAIGGIHVFEYSTDTIYMGLDEECYIAALWSFDIATGVTKKVADITGMGAMDDTIVWRSTLDSSDPSAWSWVPGSPANQIERLNLRDRTHEVWLHRPGHLVGLIGVDGAHNPIVGDFADKQNLELLVLSTATTQTSIIKGSTETWAGFISGMAADSHGVWFGGDKGFTSTRTQEVCGR